MSRDPGTTSALAKLHNVRAQQETLSRWMRPLGLLVVVVVIAIGHLSPGLHGHRLAVTVALVMFAIGAVGALLTRDAAIRVLAAFIVVLFVGSAVLVWLQPDGGGYFGLFIAVVLAARRVPRPVSAVLAVVTAGLLVGTAAARHRPLISALLTGVAFVGVFIIIALAQRLREGNEQAETMLIELEQTRGAEARAVALAERQRLAREMHDVLAHSLSGLMIQLEAARLMATENPADPRLPGTIERAHHLGKSGLEEARRAIGMLRDDDLPGPEQLATLATHFERDSGVRCQFAVSGPAHPLDSEAGLAVYRVAQEALTNVGKHARPERVEIQLAYQPDRTCLTIEDFGSNGGQPGPSGAGAGGGGGGGYGLTGMRERAELLGGSLAAGPTDSGFRVELQVPA